LFSKHVILALAAFCGASPVTPPSGSFWKCKRVYERGYYFWDTSANVDSFSIQFHKIRL